MPNQDRYLQSEERQKAIVEQKRIFLAGGQVDRSVISGMILRSWERSLAARVNPDVKERPRVGGEELEAVLAENAELMDCARDILEQMFSSMQEAVSALSLVSARGVTLYISNRVSHRAYYPDALVGSINTEEARGTNGIGTCLAERRPVEIIGAEHFRFSGECWSCSAAPIFSPDGRLIGVLNVTQPRKQYHAHTLGMVKAAVCAITEQLRLRSLLQQRETIMEMLDDGVLVLSASGGVDMMNRKAAVMFGLDVQPGRAAPAGTLADLLRPGAVLDELMRTRTHMQDQEMLFPLRSGASLSCFVSIVPLAGGGRVLTLREARRMRQVAVKMAGVKASYTFDRILGRSPALARVLDQARLVAGNHTTVLLLGESGTGKELFAQSIHNASPRASRPFVAVNCGALPRNLVESELFGYSEGAFTGASRAGQPGKFELADGGTILLDEIGDLPLDAQVSLLRLLQNGEVTRVGGKRSRTVSVRVIAATNKNLEEAVRDRSFREDLYYRLNVFPITLPPLRERRGDVALLARYFLRKFALGQGKDVPDFTPPALARMEAYEWPGNVRELENVVERMVNIVPDGQAAGESCLPSVILEREFRSPPQQEEPEQEEMILSSGLLLTREAESIEEALRRTGGNMRAAAALLGVSRGGLYLKTKRLGIDAGRWRK